MNEKDIETRLRKNQKASKRQAEKLLDEIISSIKEELHRGRRVRLRPEAHASGTPLELDVLRYETSAPSA